MADLTVQGVTPEYIPVGTVIATNTFGDASQAGLAVIADPTTKANRVAVSAGGAMSVVDATLTATNTKLDTLHTDLTSGATQAISAVSLPLPTGALDLANFQVQIAKSAKGTQPSTAIATQDLKDAGRSAVSLTIDKYQVAAAAETVVGVLQSSAANGAHSGNLTTYQITAAKTGRLSAITASLGVITGNTTTASVIVRVRAAVGAAATITSPVVFIFHLQGQAVVNQSSAAITIPFPDGWEFPATAGLAFTVECAGYVVTTAAPIVSIAAIVSEY